MFYLGLCQRGTGTACPEKDAPSLQVLKTRLEGFLGSLTQWLTALPIAEGLELDDL